MLLRWALWILGTHRAGGLVQLMDYLIGICKTFFCWWFIIQNHTIYQVSSFANYFKPHNGLDALSKIWLLRRFARVCFVGVISFQWMHTTCSRTSLCMRQANERRRYNVTSSLIGWPHTQTNPCLFTSILNVFFAATRAFVS